MMNRGQLISWNDEKGFGFIKSESLSRDTFIHISALKCNYSAMNCPNNNQDMGLVNLSS